MEDNFELIGESLICHSASGKNYELTLQSCECKGFGFRRTCRHFKQAWVKGYMSKLKKSISSRPSILQSPVIKRARQKSLVLALRKNGIEPNREVILTLEPTMTIDGPPVKELVKSARRILRNKGTK